MKKKKEIYSMKAALREKDIAKEKKERGGPRRNAKELGKGRGTKKRKKKRGVGIIKIGGEGGEPMGLVTKKNRKRKGDDSI